MIPERPFIRVADSDHTIAISLAILLIVAASALWCWFAFDLFNNF